LKAGNFPYNKQVNKSKKNPGKKSVKNAHRERTTLEARHLFKKKKMPATPPP
jgi:hypothetical protein